MKLPEIEIKSKDVEEYIDGACVDEGDAAVVVNKLLEVAVTVLNTVQASKDVDFVKNEVQRLMDSVESSIDKFETKLTDSVDGVMKSTLDIEVAGSIMNKTKVWLSEQLKMVKDEAVNSSKEIMTMTRNVANDRMDGIQKGIKEVESKFDPAIEDSYLANLKLVIKDVSHQFEEEMNPKNMESFAYKLNEEMKDYFGGDSPLLSAVESIVSQMHKNFAEDMTKLREEIAKREGLSDVMEKTAIKGFDFEDKAEESISEIASNYGDVLIRTGTEKTTSGSKKGDFIYEFVDSARIVIELKDESVGLKPMHKYLDEAMQVRECEFAILVTKFAEQLPKAVGLFNLYEGNKLFCSYDTLPFALRWVRLYLAKVKAEVVEGVDSVKIMNAMESARKIIANFRNIRSKSTSVKNAVAKADLEIQEVAGKMETDLQEIILNVEKEFE